MSKVTDFPLISFESFAAWQKWLDVHNSSANGIWIKIAKKDSGIPTVTYDEALDIALCYGWIDGIRKSVDEKYFMQKFTPRRPKSLWSKRNVGKVAELITAKKMRPAGLAEVEAAKADGRWQAAYDSQKDMVIPADFLAAVEKNPRAKKVFSTLNKSSLFAIYFRLSTAKTPETRARRFNVLLQKLENGEAI